MTTNQTLPTPPAVIHVPTTIIISGGGINWCWYHCYTTHEDGMVTEQWSDRFHKFDDMQGAGQHPVATHNLLHSYMPAADWKREEGRWPAEWLEREDRIFAEKCAAMQLDPTKVQAVLRIIPVAKGGETIEAFNIAVAK